MEWEIPFSLVFRQKYTRKILQKINFASQQKQAIRSARNKGVEIQIGRDELLESFSFLMKKTEKRKDIHLRNEAYYKKLLDNFKDKAYITLATLDIAKRLRELEEQLAKNRALEETFTESTRTSKVEAQKKEKERLLEEFDFPAGIYGCRSSKSSFSSYLDFRIRTNFCQSIRRNG